MPNRPTLLPTAEALTAPCADDELFTTTETARWLKTTNVTLEVWRSQGKGPEFIRLGSRAIRYRRGAIRAWLDAQTRKPVAA